MGYFAKKTLTGYKEVPGGYSDPDAEYYIEPMKEYRADVEKVRKAEEDAYKAMRDADEKIKQTTRNLNNQLAYYRRQAADDADRKVARVEAVVTQRDERIRELEKKLAEAEAQLKNERYLNGNLKRIAKERANADRGIKPKKEHDGYLVLSSRQWVEHYDHELTEEEYNAKPEEFRSRYRFPYTEHLTADVWKSVIQTPYEASLPLNQIRSLVEDYDLWDAGILRDIGCPKMNANDINGHYQTFGTNDEGYENNGMYKWKFVANYKSGFWELEIYTTKSLQVPEYRRPRPAGRKK